MHADLDLLLSVSTARRTTCCRAAGKRAAQAHRRRDRDLCVAQVLMGIPCDRRFLRAARRQLGHLFPCLPTQDAFHKRRARLAETIEWLIGVFAAQSPGYHDDLLLLDSTPVECGRSVETTRRSAAGRRSAATATRAATRAGSGACACTCLRPRRHPTRRDARRGRSARARGRAAAARPRLRGGETIVCDKGYAGREFAARRRRARRHDLRPRAATSPNRPPPRPDPAADRVGLLDLQRPARPRTPRRPHPAQPLRPHRDPPPRARRLHQPQPPTRPTQAAQSPTTPPNPVASTI